MTQTEQTRLEADEATTRLTQARTALRTTKDEENATRESVKQLGKSEADRSANVATLERRQRDLGLSIEGLQQQKTELEQLFETGTRQLEDVRSATSKARSELDQTLTDLTEAEQSLTETTTGNENAREELRATLEQVEEANREKTRLETQHRALEAQILKLGPEAAGMEARITRLRDDEERLQGTVRKAAEAIAQMGKDREAAVQEALDAESRMHEAQAALDRVEASRGAAERQVTELETKKAALRSDLTRLRTARDEANAGLEGAATAHRSRRRCAPMTWPSWVAQGWILQGATTLTAVLVGFAVAILVGAFRRGELDQWRARIAALLAEHDRVSASFTSIDAEYRDAKNTIEQAQQIRRDGQALDTAREEVTRTVAELESRLDQKQRQLQGADEKLAEMERLRRATDGLDAEKNRLEAELKKHSELHARLRDQISHLKKEVSELQADAQEARRIRDQAKEECEGAIRQRDNALQELAAAKEVKETLENAQLTGGEVTFPEGPLRVQVDRPEETGPGIDELRDIPACLTEVADYEPLPTDRPVEREDEFLDNLEQQLEVQRLRYHPRTVRAFHTAVKTRSISPLTVLAGVSGTGKSQLPREYARALGAAFLHVPVEPGWDSPQDLLGFYDYISGQYRATERAQLLVHFDSANWPGEAEPFTNRLAVILLDEMNLARTGVLLR